MITVVRAPRSRTSATKYNGINGNHRRISYAGVRGAGNMIPRQSDSIINDWDMEDSGVSAWTAGNSATLSKQSDDVFGGSQCLRVAVGDVSKSPYALQSTGLTVGSSYRVTGYVRNDGTGRTYPVVYMPSTSITVGSVTSTDAKWTFFDLEFSSITLAQLRLYSGRNGALVGDYCEYDRVWVEEIYR